MVKESFKIFISIVCWVFVSPSYSQKTATALDSIWQTPQGLISYGIEQAHKNNLDVISQIEDDPRFDNFDVPVRYDFYNQLQLHFGQSGNMQECVHYMIKCITFAADNNREDLLYISNGDNYTYSQYYWLNSYCSMDGSPLDYQDFFDAMMKHLKGVMKMYGINSKEFLVALLSPYFNCNYRSLVESEHFGYAGNDSVKTVSQIVRNDIDASFKADDNHQRLICLNNAIDHCTDSLSLAEVYYEYARYLLDNYDYQEGIALMINSIALRSRHTRDFFDTEQALDMIATLAVSYYRYGADGQMPDYIASYAMNKMLYEIVTALYPNSDFLIHRRADIISAATRLWLFDEADSLLTMEERENHKDRVIANTYARALFYYEKGAAANDIQIAAQSVKYFEKLKGTWHWNRFTTLQMLQDVYFGTKQYRKLEKLQRHILDQTKEQAINQILSMSSRDRENSLAAINSNTIYRISSPKLLEQGQDAALFRKNILTSAEIEIDRLANESSEGKKLLEEYRQMKYYSLEEADYLEKQILSYYIDPSRLRKALDYTTKDIRKQLNNHELFLDFEACDDSLIATIITKNHEIQMVELCELERFTRVNSTNNDLNIIVSTLSPMIEDYSVVYFSPTYDLFLLNIEILFRLAFPDKEFHRVSNVARFKTKSTPINKVVAMGNPRYNDERVSLTSGIDRGNVWAPLPGTGIELREIENAMYLNKEISVSCYDGKEANEETIKSLDGTEINVLHIATHGAMIDHANGIKEPALILSGANVDFEAKKLAFGENDGILLSSEIENLRFHNLRLVVLSACDSGIGSINYNDGIRGLQRAFRIAGAQNLIVSLRRVDDEGTLNFMTDFYKMLSQTNDIYQSFVYAQTKADEETRNSFILIE